MWARTENLNGNITSFIAYDSNNINDEYVLNLTGDTTIDDLLVGPNVVINLNGYSLSITTLNISSDSGIDVFAGNLIVNGGGSISVTSINKNSVDTISIINVDSVSDNLSSYSSVTYTLENTFKWMDEDANGDLNDYGNWNSANCWLQLGSDGNYHNSSNFPNSSDCTVYFSGNEGITVNVTESVKVGAIYVHHERNNDLEFSIDSGVTLLTSAFYLELPATGSGHTTIISGSGTVECSEFRVINNSSDEGSFEVTVALGATLKITGILRGIRSSENSVTFSENGTIYIPASGELLDYIGSVDSSCISFSKTPTAYGSPTYYKIVAFDAESSPPTLTLSRYSDSAEITVSYPYIVKSYTGTAETYAVGDEREFSIASGNATKDFQVSATGDDSFEIEIRTPDNRFSLGTIVYPQIVVEDFNTYYWTGANSEDSTLWTASANWAYKDKDRDLYVSVAEYDDGKYGKDGEYGEHYPGFADGDTAVFQETTATDIKSLSLAGKNFNLTILSNSSGRMALSNCSTNADNAHITIGGTQTLILNACKFGSLTVDEDAEIRLIHSSGQSISLEVNSLDIKSGADVWGNTGAVLKVNGDLKLSGSISDNASGKIRTISVGGETTINSDGKLSLSSSTQMYTGRVLNEGEIALGKSTVTFDSGYSGSGSLSVSTGTITFNGTASNTVSNLSITGTASVTNNASTAVSLGAVSCGSADVIFTGDFTETGAFSASSVKTFFVDGDVDFSASTASFDASGGTVYFYRTASDTESKRTFTTQSGMTFNDLYFGGNVDINLNGAVKAANCKMIAMNDTTDESGNETSSYLQAESFKATFTGSGTLEATSVEIERMSTINEVVGTLVFDTNAKVTDFTVHSGTTVQVNESKEVEVATYKVSGGTLGSPEINLNVNGTLTVTTLLDTKVDYDSKITIGENGTLVTESGTIDAKTLTNAGNLTTTSGSVTATTLENTGTISVAGNGSLLADSIENTKEITVTTGSVSAGKVTSTGDNATISLGAGSLSVTGSEYSSISEIALGSTSESGGTLSNTGSGTLSVTSLTAGDAENSEKAKSVTLSNTGAGTFYTESAIFYADSVSISNSNSAENSLSFNYFSEEDLGGSSVLFTGRVDFVDSSDGTQAKLVLTGSDSDSLLSIKSSDEGVIYLPRAMAYGNYLSVSQKVTVGGAMPTNWNKKTQPADSYTTYNSEYAETGVTAIYGWLFTTEYYWSGITSTAWNLKENWRIYSLVSTGRGRNKTYSYQAKTASKLPDSAAIVYINSTYPVGAKDSGSTATVTNFPVLSADVTVTEAHIGEKAKIDLNGNNLTVTGEFTNSGTIYLQGTETISLSDTATNTENGTWSFSGGTVAAIENLFYTDGSDSYSFKNLEITGNAQIGNAANGSVSAETLSLQPSSTLTLTAGNASSTLSAKNTVELENDLVLDVNGSTFTIDFNIAKLEEQEAASASIQFSDSSSSGGNLSFKGNSIVAKNFTIDDGVVFSVDGDSSDSSTVISLSGNWTDSNDYSAHASAGFVAHDYSTVQFTDSATITGNTTFKNLSATNLGGETLTFDGNFTVSGDLTLTGSSLSSLLQIQTADSPATATSPARINLSSAQLNGKYLEVSGVTIGEEPSDWDGKTIPVNSYTANSSIPKVESDGSYTIPYGWQLLMDFIWTGSTDTDWDISSNWLFYDEGAEPEKVTATIIPNSMSSVVIPYATNQPHLSSEVEIAEIEIRNDTNFGELWLAGYSFTVTESFSNEGTIHLRGLYGTSETEPQPEIITLPSDMAKISENGTWAYFGGGDGAGILQPIPNLTFNKVVAEGSGNFKSFTAERFELREDFSSAGEITLKPFIADSDTNTSVEVDSALVLASSATIDLNETPLVLKKEIADSGNSEILTVQNGSNGSHTIQFDGEISASLTFTNKDSDSDGEVGAILVEQSFTQSDGFNLVLDGGTLTFASDFTQGETCNLTVSSGTMNAGESKFVAGNLIIESGASFVQTGINTGAQSVSSINNDGFCEWDAGEEGGTLVLNGNISGSNASETVFNKKNVSAGKNAELSGVFYDLTIADGVTVTNGNGITVRRNLTVNGNYTHNSQTLRLGEITISVNGEEKTFTSEDDENGGVYSDTNEAVNLGTVEIVQNSRKKTFVIPVKIESLLLDYINSDSTASVGAVIFEKTANIASLSNSAGTIFDISFLNGANFPSGAAFNTSGTLSLGGEFTTSADFSVAASTILTSDVNFSASGQNLNFDGEVSGEKNLTITGNSVFDGAVSCEDFKITGDTIFNENVSSKSISFTGTTTIGANAKTEPTKITTTLTQNYTGTVDLKKSAVFTAQSADSYSELQFTAISGSAGADGEIFGSTVQFVAGNYVLSGKLTAHASEKILFSEGIDGTLSAGGGFDFSDSDVYFDFGSSTLALDSVFEAKNLYFFDGIFALEGASQVKAGNFVAFGANYSADDARFAGDDTRFAYFGFDSLQYIPLDSSSVPKRSAEISASAGAKVTVSGNFYLNGLDLSNISLSLPDSSSSHPVFNASSAVTETQWGVPYAVAFNSVISHCSASAETGSAFVAASVHQNCANGSGEDTNSGFQFAVPKVSEAYSVSDSVLCVIFDMDLENSNGEVAQTVALISSLETGGIFYNANGTDGLLSFDGIFYTQTDGTTCSVPLSESDFASSDIPALTPLYLKVSSDKNKWNTDATPDSSGTEDSTDRSGVHREKTIDVSFFEGLFYAAQGKTMARNYGIGLWKEDSETEYTSAEILKPLDRARPVLVDVFVGQELFSKNTGAASSQKFYDSHNFIEFRYSEPVNIGDLASGSETENQNVQANATFASDSEHGGAISNLEGGGISIAGFALVESGELTAGFRNGESHTIDTAKPHALYRKFSRNTQASEIVQKNRLRIAIAGFVDEANPVSYNGSEFHNWLGYIDSSTTPSGTVTVAANNFITDCAVDSDGNALKNMLDETNSRVITVNSASASIDSASSPFSATSLYGEWDCLPPVFAAYVTNIDNSDESLSWASGDSTTRQYEMVGTVDSNTNAYIEKIEMHLFDNKQTYSDSDSYKWVAGKGWVDESQAVMSGFSAPESAGGSRGFSSNPSKTYGGIRRSSLAAASSAFSYTYSLDGHESESRDFATAEISQNVKSSLFRTEEQSETFTDDDGVYISVKINEKDSTLPIKTVFTITYSPEKSFITDLAGNRLIQTDDNSSQKILHTVDITSPSFTMTISPIGENKIYAVFTKPLAFNGTYLHEMGGELASVLEKIKSNIEFVYSEEDSVDTSAQPSGDAAISVTDVELLTKTTDYSALLFTLDRTISLDDVEKIWIRINNEGEITETIFGKVISSYIQDRYGNALPSHTCHAISDFAVNAVNMLYAYADDTEETGWDEQGVYGEGLAPLSSDYAVHDFSADGGNYSRLRSGKDIVFQYELIGGADSSGKFAVQNGETLKLIFDSKANIHSDWKSDKYNLLTGGDWRIWIDKPLDSLASSYNDSPLSQNLSSDSPEYEDVDGSEILKNMIWKNDMFNLSAGREYQFFFKIVDSDGNIIEINHDGDSTTEKIPLYAFRMPSERIAAGDFSFIDLWSFSVSDITRQRGGVTILNNVINAGIGEKTAIEVNMQREGNLNIYIMTLDGNIIKRLSKGTVSQGTHYFYWDGKNNAGNPVARGLYFVRVAGSGIDETRKVMVVK